ncbi:MAG: 50S ribosomal protein L31 [Anaerolineae bacterium]|nr:50S ribosomal protein L31 [Anaerolineae bacterium]MCA9910684.1 50S ribosomal protein L31 [Anaerolineae bacterium]
MREKIHPTWYPEAVVTCACGNSWTTGATQPEIKTDICSKCHPFYTGEQRIVDTEGQVDRFIKRLQVRDSKRQEAEERAASKTPLTLPIAELSLNSRYIKALSEAGITTAGDFLSHLESDGEDKLAEAPGINPKLIHDVKKQLTERGYNVPNAEAEA